MAKDFEAFFKELVKERIDEMEYPHEEEMGMELLTQLRVQRREKKRKRFFKQMKIALASCVIFGLITILYAAPRSQVMDLTNKAIKSVMMKMEGTIKTHKKIDSDFGQKTDHYLPRNENSDPRIEEAQIKIHFKLLIPEYIPKDFRLSNVDVLNKYEKNETVDYFYLKQNNKENEFFEIMQWGFQNQSEGILKIKKNEAVEIKSFSVDGIKYTIVNYGDLISEISWDQGDIGYEISGSITTEEMIKIAKSMK